MSDVGPGARVGDIPGEPPGPPPAGAGTWAGCSDDELTVAFDQLVGVARATAARLVSVTGEVARRGLAETDGCRDLTSWVVARSGEARRWAAALSRVARRCEDGSALAEAMAAGLIGIGHADAIAKIGAALPEVDPDSLVAEACGRSVDQLEVTLRRARRVTREQDNEALSRRSLRWWDSAQPGMVHFSGELRADDAATVTETISRLAESAERDPTTGTWESFDARCADALVELAAGWDPKDNPNRALVVFHTDLEAVLGRGGSSSSDDGEAIGVAGLRRMLCDCRLQTMVHGPAGTCVGVGRTSRVIPGWLRRVIRWRDRTCRWPGCPRRHWIDAHHLVHWADGGPTDTANLLSLCGYHHRLAHGGEWALEGHPDDEVRFVAPSGRVYTSRPQPPEPALIARCQTSLWPEAPPPPGDPPGAAPPGAMSADTMSADTMSADTMSADTMSADTMSADTMSAGTAPPGDTACRTPGST